MGTRMKEISKKLSDMIIAKVMEDIDSPYQLMRRKLKNIDIDYFEDISRDTEIIDPKLNLGLKDRIRGDFQRSADELLEESGLKEQVTDEIKEHLSKQKQQISPEEYTNILADVVNELRNYANQLLQTVDIEKITESELAEKYEKAKLISLKEKILRNNKRDVIEFYHALMERSWWECSVFVEKRIVSFLMSLADELAASEANGIQATDTIEYVPQCTSTDDFTLPDELAELVEKMAENVHEEWAQERIRQGWTYGKERNDTLKQHPCLIPYEELPEEEKQFDRITSIKTLQFIISQGFKITRNADR